MEPFKLTRQSIAFIALMGGVAVVVGVAAPFGSIALGAVALLAVGVVLVKAMLRARNWWPLTAVEGTVALSGLVLVVGGLAVVAYSIVRLGTGDPLRMMIGWPLMAEGPRAGVSSRAVYYSDPDMRQRLKDGLRAAGVPFTVKMDDGKEYVGWTAEHAAAAEAVNAKVKEGLPNGRNARFPDPALQKQFTDWLEKKGIKHEVVQGSVVWGEGAGDAVREFMESRSR